MKKITLWSLVMLAAGVAAFTFPQRKKAAPPKRPNLLIILVDQYRGQALGIEHKEQVFTPNLDSLARNGYLGEQMITNYPVCSPSRAMMMSGLYPLKNKVCGNVNSNTAPYGVELPADTRCWSDVLKANGYYNGYIGKWHLDSPHEPYIPTSNNTKQVAWNEWTSPDRRHGFDYWYAYGTYDMHMRPMYWDTKANRDGFHYVNEWGPQHEADKAIEFLGDVKKKNTPFSLVVSMNPPHSPYTEVPQRYVDLYKNVPLTDLLKDPNIPAENTPMGQEYRKSVKYYYACIAGVDDQVGRIVHYLKEQKLDNNTLVMFIADHGNCLGKHDEISKNNIYEESLRIPLIFYWKGHIHTQRDTSLLMTMADIYPTLLDLLGLKSKIPAGLEGHSFAVNVLKGRGMQSRYQYFLGAINPPNMLSGFRGIRTGQYKLAYVNQKGKVAGYLFDLRKDPFELNNLYNDKDATVQKLRPVLLSWLNKTNDPFSIQTQH